MNVDFYEVAEFIRENVYDKTVELNGVNIPLIFLQEKPVEVKDVDSYIVYSFREIDGGKAVRHFAVSIIVNAKTVNGIYEIRQNIIDQMDWYYKPCPLKNGYKKFVLSNEGGVYKDDISGYYVDKLFFDCTRV